MSDFVIGMVEMAAQQPETTRRLKILDPSTLLTAISLEPCIAAEMLTDSSGALVPNATIVNPTMTLGMRR